MATAVRDVRAEHCDVMVDFGAWRRFDEVLTALSGARVHRARALPGQHRHFAMARHRGRSPADHELDNDRRLVAALGINSTSPPSVPFDPTVPAPHDHPYVVLHLWPGGANFEERSWPTERWFELAQGLADAGLRHRTHRRARGRGRDGATSWPTGGPGASRPRAWPGRSWVETVAWLRHSAGTVSVNTGVMHVAAGLAVPTIALNGPTSGRRWGPIGVHTRCVASPIVPDGYLNLGFEQDEQYRDAMLGITVPMVLGAWDDMSDEVAADVAAAVGRPGSR